LIVAPLRYGAMDMTNFYGYLLDQPS